MKHLVFLKHALALILVFSLAVSCAFPAAAEESLESESSGESDVSDLDVISGSSTSEEDSSSDVEASESSVDSEAVPLADSQYIVTVGGHETYMSGYEDSTFRPGNRMTRAEVAQMLYNLLVTKPESVNSNFTDVNSDAWYYTAVNALADLDVVSGMDTGIYNPGGDVTRAQFVTILCRIFEKEGTDADFSDVDSSHWAYKYISAAYEAGWIAGDGDGTFRPNDGISRCEVTKVTNMALERDDDDFAANATKQIFSDVPVTHWAYKEIAEAAKPQNPYEPPEWTGYVSVTASTGLNLRSGPSTSDKAIATLLFGSVLTVISESDGWLQVETMGGTKGYVSAEYTKPCEAPDKNDPDEPDTPVNTTAYVTVTATGGLNLRDGSSADSAVITVLNTGAVLEVVSRGSEWTQVKTSAGQTGYVKNDYIVDYTPQNVSVSLSSKTIPQYMTIYLTGSGGTTWSSDNTDVATVSNGYVYAKSQGTANISYSNGAAKATCKLTVVAPEDVRIAYSDQNVASRGQEFNLVAVTDTGKTSVKFEVTGPDGGTYETSEYSTEAQMSDNGFSAVGIPDNNIRVFKRAVTLNTAGEYTVKAYSNSGSGYGSEVYCFTLLVVSSQNTTETTYDKRMASTELINIIAGFEGFLPTVYQDTLANNIPTLGYGYVLSSNEVFYNNLTKTEAIAMLSEKVNTGGYASGVNQFRSTYNLKMSQCQFDALVSFVYNLGPGTLSDEYAVMRVVNNAVTPPNVSESAPKSAQITLSSSAVYKTASSAESATSTLNIGTSVNVVEIKRISSTGEMWYKIKSGDISGWIRGGTARFDDTSLTHDLNYVDAITFGNNMLQWSHAGPMLIPGLILRRQAEARLFSYNDYKNAYSSSPGYKTNPGYTFPTV